MPDYKEMYLKMARAAEEAIRILVQAQQDCEELYLADADKGTKLQVLSWDGEEKKK